MTPAPPPRETFSCTLPFPPSANTMYIVNRQGRRFASSNYRKWKEAALQSSGKHDPPIFGPEERLHLEIRAFPPDRRKRDLDNITKPIQDLLETAGVFPDDCMVDRIALFRIRPDQINETDGSGDGKKDNGEKRGTVEVEVSPLSFPG